MRFSSILVGISTILIRPGNSGKSKSSSCEKSDLYGKTPVVDLCDAHFPNKNSEHVWMVEFYAPWCGHCQALKPKYISAAKKAKKEADLYGGIKLGAVDCTKEQALCAKYGVKGYPTLKTFVGGKAKEYNGPRETEDILHFMWTLKESKGTKGGSSKCSSSLADSNKHDAVPLCSSHFPDKKSKHNWVVLFHSEIVDKSKLPTVRNELYSLAEKVTAGGAKVGLVDCSTDKKLCEAKLGSSTAEQMVENAITVKTYARGKDELSSESLTGALSDPSAIIKFVKKELGTKFKLPTTEKEEL